MLLISSEKKKKKKGKQDEKRKEKKCIQTSKEGWEANLETSFILVTKPANL